MRGDCGVCVWSGGLGSPLQVTCRCRLFSSVVSCCSGRGVAGVVSSDGIGGLGESQMRLVAFPVSPLLRKSCGESQLWSLSRPRRRPRVAIRARCCTVVLFSDALVAKAGAALVCSCASSLWVAILSSLCSSQGTCVRNSASSPYFFVASGHDVLRWLLISGKAFCGCSNCFLVVRSVVTMWACCALLWLGIICGACCESANRLSTCRWSRFACFQCLPCTCIKTGCTPYPKSCTGSRAVLACPCPSPKGWYGACKGESPGYYPVIIKPSGWSVNRKISAISPKRPNVS